jgi:signal transduction histidine kinase/CheY-like chemotaxis protein
MGNAILVVDDERNFLNSIQLLLEDNGYAVDLAQTGSDAFRFLQENSYQAVLLDLLLPDIEGIELAEFLTQHFPDTAVVILTGHASMDSAIRALRYGVIDYLLKPCKPELLLKIIARGIETIRLKKEVIASRNKFEQLAAATWEGIAFFKGEHLQQCNPQFAKIFQLPEMQCTCRHIHEFIMDWQDCLTLLGQCAEDQPAIFETSGIHNNGTSFPLEMRVQKIAENDNLRWVAAFRDISARKRDEISRLKMQEELVNAQRMESIGLMAGSVAHDLNNILTSIVTFPELLLHQMPATERYRKDIEKIQKAGKQAAAVVADLLTVARGATCTKELCDLNKIVEAYRNSLNFSQLQHNNPTVEISFQLEPKLMEIVASSLHISKSILNLVINAVEATSHNGKILVATENRTVQKMFNGYESIPTGAYTVLSVRDNGPGITTSNLKRIFEPFFSTKNLGRSGTGLGLTVIWNTVRDHQGYIDIQSNTEGSCFELYFPISYTVNPPAIPNMFS